MKTVEFMYAPSKSIKMFLPRCSGVSVNVLRYHPIPPGRAPPPVPDGLSLLKSPSIAQSWGSERLRHDESSNSGFAISGESASVKRHPSLKLSERESAAAAEKMAAPPIQTRQAIKIKFTLDNMTYCESVTKKWYEVRYWFEKSAIRV